MLKITLNIFNDIFVNLRGVSFLKFRSKVQVKRRLVFRTKNDNNGTSVRLSVCQSIAAYL